MITARDQFIATYTTHYRRLNAGRLPSLSPEMVGSLRLMYGALLASLPAGSPVLDVGCGTGVLLRWFASQPGITAVGVDRSSMQVEQARREVPGVEVSCDDGLAYLRRHPDTFGAIYCLDVLEHVPSMDQCLEWVRAVRAALVPNGFFVCRTPNGANLTASYARYMDLTHERCFTSASLVQLLESGGLEECRTIPYQASHLTGRVRHGMEAALHRVLFRICGHSQEAIFTNNVHAVGYRRSPRIQTGETA